MRPLPGSVVVPDVDHARTVGQCASVGEAALDSGLAMQALPLWPDEAPTPPVVSPRAGDREEPLSYDDLFGSTQRAMAFQAEDEPVTPPPPEVPAPEVPAPEVPAPEVPAPEASDLTLPPPTESAMGSCARPDAHASPVHAPVPLSQRARPAPPGILRLSNGEVVSLDRNVLLGRAPTVTGDPAGPERPHVLRLVSPENDISRNHAEVRLKGSQVMVRDLGSMNGTTVARPGQAPVQLRPDDQQVIEPGTVVALAEEVSFTYEAEA